MPDGLFIFFAALTLAAFGLVYVPAMLLGTVL